MYIAWFKKFQVVMSGDVGEDIYEDKNEPVLI